MTFLKRNWIIALFVPVLLFTLLTITAQAQVAETLAPDYFAGGFAMSKEIDTTKAFPWMAFGYNLDENEKAINFTSLDFSQIEGGSDGANSILGYEFQLTVRTGLGYRLFEYKKVSLYALGDVGMVTAGGITTSSVGWGGFVHYDINDWFGAIAILQGERSPLLGTDLKPRFGITIDFNKLAGM